MQIINQKIVALILLISLFLQSCGVSVPLEEKPHAVEHRSAIELTELSSETTDLQVQSVPATTAISPTQSVTGSIPMSQSSPSPALVPTQSVPQTPSREREREQELYDRISQGIIKSTQEIVEAFNSAQDTETQELCYRCIRDYVIDRFSDRAPEVLTPEVMQEYAYLVHIKPDTVKGRMLLLSYFRSLANKASENRLGEEYTIETLDNTLWQLEDTIFRGSTVDLIRVGAWLLKKVDPRSGQVKLDRGNYVNYASILSALHSILLLIRKIDPEGWSPSKDQELYSGFQGAIEAIKKNTNYYPYVYYSHLLNNSLKGLEVSESKLGTKMWQGIKALNRCYGVGCKLVAGEIDIEAIEKAGTELLQTFDNVRIGIAWVVDELYGDKDRLNWYERLGKLSEAGLCAWVQEDKSAWSTFTSQIEEVKRDDSILQREYPDDGKAFQYGVINQLTMLALQSKMSMECLEQLNALSTLPLWDQDLDIMVAIFEGMQAIHKKLQGAARIQEANIALGYLQSCEAALEVLREQKEERWCFTSKSCQQIIIPATIASTVIALLITFVWLLPFLLKNAGSDLSPAMGIVNDTNIIPRVVPNDTSVPPPPPGPSDTSTPPPPPVPSNTSIPSPPPAPSDTNTPPPPPVSGSALKANTSTERFRQAKTYQPYPFPFNPNLRALCSSADVVASPWNSAHFCKLYVEYEGISYACSGTLVGPYHLLTARHCTYNPCQGGLAKNVKVYCGLGYRSDSEEYAHFGSANVVSYVWYSAYDKSVNCSNTTTDETTGMNMDYDIQLCKLDRKIGEQRVGWLPMPSSSQQELLTNGLPLFSTLGLNVAGYPHEGGASMFKRLTRFVSVSTGTNSKRYILEDAQVSRGENGGSYYAYIPPATQYVVAVHLASKIDETGCVAYGRLVDDVWIETYKALRGQPSSSELSSWDDPNDHCQVIEYYSDIFNIYDGDGPLKGVGISSPTSDSVSQDAGKDFQARVTLYNVGIIPARVNIKWYASTDNIISDDDQLLGTSVIDELKTGDPPYRWTYDGLPVSWNSGVRYIGALWTTTPSCFTDDGNTVVVGKVEANPSSP